MNVVRFCVYHIGNNCGKRQEVTRKQVMEMCAWRWYLQVDVCGGDHNKSGYHYFNDQKIPSFQQSGLISSFDKMVKVAASAANEVKTKFLCRFPAPHKQSNLVLDSSRKEAQELHPSLS